MPDTKTYLAVFEDIEPAANGIEKLHELGVTDDDMNVISGIPVRPSILDRPSAVTRVATIGFFGAILGFLGGVFLVCEMTMLGLMGFSFIGMFVDSGFPSYTPKQYIPEISAGKIGVLFSVPE